MTNTSTFTSIEFIDFLKEIQTSHITYCDQLNEHNRNKPFDINCVFTQAELNGNITIKFTGLTCSMNITGITNIEFTPIDNSSGTACIHCKKRPSSRTEYKIMLFINYK